ncbi:cyclin-dependent kinase 2-interacting protein [Cyclopterus lumpus]|uniref:Cyclin dependent kinase 2 interacting protein n=1 Tax=Cyclopterus lumpus TaxID=8103 RepID=A0A8C3G3X3_CYCLU|nr:cyclin-dependent kinase 2-interacting protein [Cyclopterus lumpus]
MEVSPGDITVTQANRKCPAVTGSTRKIKDNAADWHNLIVKWEKLNDDGFKVAGNMVDIRMTRSQSDQLVVDESSSPPSPSSAPLQQTGGAAELQDECCKLQDVMDKMVVVVKKMERITASQQGLQDLEAFQFGLEGRKCPLFHSWNAKQFKESSCILLDSFSQELKLKQTILQELAHTVTSDLCMVYLSCWLHQPFITPQTSLTMEALLLETGHH